MNALSNFVQNRYREQKLAREKVPEKVVSHALKLPLLPKQQKQMKNQQEQGLKKKAKAKKPRLGKKRKNPLPDRSGKKAPKDLENEDVQTQDC